MIFLLEFHLNVNQAITFHEEISYQGQKYKFKGLVRHKGLHFPCAVLKNGRWNFTNDLKDDVLICNNLERLFVNHNGGWFFLLLC